MGLFSDGTEIINGGALLEGGIPTATIVPWTASSVPSGFLECAGAAVSRTTYSGLFAVVGTTYGAGNGSTTFNVPDLQDNTPVGKSGTKALASTGGANTVAVASGGNISTTTNTATNITGNVAGSTANATLSTAQLASHSHSAAITDGQRNSSGAPRSLAGNGNTGNSGSGSGHSHNMSANFSGNASSNSSSTSNFSGNTANPSVLQPYLTLIYIIKT